MRWPWTAVAHARCSVSTSTPTPTRFAAPFARRRSSTHPDRGGDRVAFELVVLAFETLQHVDVVRAGCRRRAPELPGARPRIDVYDSPLPVPAAARLRRRAPRRDRPPDAELTGTRYRPSVEHVGAGRARSDPGDGRARTRTTPTPVASTSSPRCSRVDGVLEVHGEAPLRGRDAIRGVPRRRRRRARERRRPCR